MSKNKSNSTGLSISTGDMPLHIALRKFKKLVDESGKLEDVKNRMHYEKPTTTRKKKAGAARARWLKKLKDQELPKSTY